MDKDKIYILHIRDAINKLEEASQGKTLADLQNDWMLLDVLVRELEIIGEAANNLSSEFKNQYPTIPWIQIVGMRNHLIHEYFGVQEEIIWKAVTEELSVLKEVIAQAVDSKNY